MEQPPKKFTQEIKDAWITALKSGKYKQGYVELEDCDRHCCIGVLGAITPGLDNTIPQIEDIGNNPYNFLNNTIGKENTQKLYFTNDNGKRVKDYEHDYSNVLALVEALPVTE